MCKYIINLKFLSNLFKIILSILYSPQYYRNFMSEQFKQIQTNINEFVSSTSSKAIEYYTKNPKKAGIIIGVPIAGFAATFGAMTLMHTEKDAPAITCEVSKKWQESRKNSEQKFGGKTTFKENKNTQEDKTTSGNSTISFTEKPKELIAESNNSSPEKIIGTITTKELEAIIDNQLNLKPESRDNLPSLTNIFNKVLLEIDKEKLLANEEQMDLYLWFLKKYPNLVVVDGRINPNNLKAFVSDFNTETERVRNVGFERLAKQNCKPDATAKIVNTNSSSDSKTNYLTVSNLMDLEQADRANSPKNKSIVEAERNIALERTKILNEIAIEREAAKKANQSNEYEKSKTYLDKKAKLDELGNGFVLNLPKARKSNISETEEIARKLLVLSNLLSPEKNLNQNRLNRLGLRLNTYFDYAKVNGENKDPNQFRADLHSLTSEVVAIDNELRDEKNALDALSRIGAGVMVGGIVGLGAIGYLALKDRRRQKQADGVIQATDVYKDLEKVNEGLKQDVVDAGRIALKPEMDGTSRYLEMIDLDPIVSGNADALSDLLEHTAEIDIRKAKSAVRKFHKNHPEEFHVIGVLNYDDLAFEIENLKSIVNESKKLNPTIRIKEEIEAIKYFLDDLIDFIHNTMLSSIKSSNSRSEAEKYFFDLQNNSVNNYIPKLMQILDKYLSNILGIEDKIILSNVEIKLFDDIEKLTNSIPRPNGINIYEGEKPTLNQDDIDYVKAIFKEELKINEPVELGLFKKWFKTLQLGFDYYQAAKQIYIQDRNITEEELENSPSRLQSVKIKSEQLKAEIEQFVSIFSKAGIDNDYLLAYYEHLFPRLSMDIWTDEWANDKIGGVSLLLQLLDSGIIQKSISNFDIVKIVQSEPSSLKALLTGSKSLVDGVKNGKILDDLKETASSIFNAGIVGNIENAKSAIHKATETENLPKPEISLTKELLYLYGDLKDLYQNLELGASDSTSEVNEYKESIVLPILELIRDFDNYSVETNNQVQSLIIIHKKLKQNQTKDQSQLLITRYKVILESLRKDDSFINFNVELIRICSIEGKLMEKAINSIPNSKELKSIIKNCSSKCLDFGQIFSKIEETL